MIRRSAFIALARVAAAAFFLVTSLYCLLTYNAFAYQQFVRPHLIAALTDFTVWHGILYWIVLLVTALTLLPSASRGPARFGAWIYLAVSAAIGVWLLMGQVLPQVENSPRSLGLALAALVPPICLAAIDHLAVSAVPAEPSDDRRLLVSAVLAAIVAWAVYAAVAPLRRRPSGAIAISWGDLVLGVSSSAIAHLAVFTMVGLIVTTMLAVALATRWGPRGEYGLLVAGSAAGVTVVVLRLIFAPIAFRGSAAWAVAALTGVMVALTWSSIARYRHADAPAPRPTAMDLWLAPISSSRSRVVPIAGLLLVAPIAYVLTTRAAVFDWNFMVQELIAPAVWLFAFGLVHAACTEGAWVWNGGRVAVPLVVLALYSAEAAALPRLPGWLDDPRLHPDFVLDGYAAVDPSYKLIHDTLISGPGADPEFYAYLRANSTIDPKLAVAPVEVDFVRPLASATGDKPNIFFFLIDSLRSDYVSPYNVAVGFTPRIAAFTGEPGTHVFTRAFSRYGGTALSMPAIFAGGMILHKLYVTPFAPMNALEKLLVVNDYQRLITKDSISELFTPSASTTWLGGDTPEMEHMFCSTARELETGLAAWRAGGPPLFVHTRTLDLHVSLIRSAEAPAGKAYPGFNDAYAARMEQIDGCFGQVMDVLKTSGLYDNSVIVLSSDHGDSLGEEQRWGHAYTLFPEVMRIPLLMHLPPSLEGRLAADLGRVSLSTDITPTLYALLGYHPADLGPLFGAPLFDTPEADWSGRRRASLLLASSYGAVYGLLSQNGRSLYIADAINEREYAYEVKADALGTRVGLDEADRARNRRLIREQVAQLAAEYHYTPRR